LLSSEKSVSDLEYALDALDAGAGTVVVGAHRDHEGRTDHLFINLLILAKRRGLVFADNDSWIAPLLGEKMALRTKPGVLLTVAPLKPGGIQLNGTQYRFKGEHTSKHISEGLSNKVTSRKTTISVQKSALLFVGESLLQSKYSISALR
jgi:thiamine pyrophosphokinase